MVVGCRNPTVNDGFSAQHCTHRVQRMRLSPPCEKRLTFDELVYNYIVMEPDRYMPDATSLDAVFHALADGTRRAILSRLADGAASVNEIAEPFDISQPAVSRHLKVLERAGLIERDIDQQRRPARLKAENMLGAVDWLAEFLPMWGTSFSQLDDLLVQMKQNKQKETNR